MSTLTHALGAAIALVAAVGLVRRGRGRAVATLSLAVFAASCILLLTMSAIYHAFPHDTVASAVFQRLDHAAIFVLIAATFTPVHAILFRGPWRWAVLVVIWAIAAAALTLKTIFFASLPEVVGFVFYIGMGWLGAGTGWVLWRHFGARFIRPALMGGVAYTVGGLMGFAAWPVLIPGVIGGHELFHFASLAGMYAFWVFIADVAGRPPIGRPGRSRGSEAGYRAEADREHARSHQAGRLLPKTNAGAAAGTRPHARSWRWGE